MEKNWARIKVVKNVIKMLVEKTTEQIGRAWQMQKAQASREEKEVTSGAE